jgi:hypothetical protein
MADPDAAFIIAVHFSSDGENVSWSFNFLTGSSAE